MAKLLSTIALVSLLFVLVLLAESSSAYRNIVTSVEIDEDPTGSQSCRQEADEKREVIFCRHLITKGPRVTEETLMKTCCYGLQKVREDCRCEAFKYMVERAFQMKAGEVDEKSLKGMKERAKKFPAQCGIEQCDIHVGFL
ncbi:2S seed storage albumin protein [Euphorbia peplus]|nr:2S seed storage albumin protein [Euphorbia peplus]